MASAPRTTASSAEDDAEMANKLALKPIYIRLRRKDIAVAKREAHKCASHYQTVIRGWVARQADRA